MFKVAPTTQTWRTTCKNWLDEEDLDIQTDQSTGAWTTNMAPKRRQRKASAKRKPKKESQSALKARAKRMALAATDMMYTYKASSGIISTSLIPSTSSAWQAPWQDIPLQLFNAAGPIPQKDQRLGADIYLQNLVFEGTLLRAGTGSLSIPQRFRVTVMRWIGESDVSIDNTAHNGFDITSDAHALFPGEIVLAKQTLRNQVQVLFDRTYQVAKSTDLGVMVKINVPIKKKMTYEFTSSGPSAVGAGNTYLVINSTGAFNVLNYKSYGLYKDLN